MFAGKDPFSEKGSRQGRDARHGVGFIGARVLFSRAGRPYRNTCYANAEFFGESGSRNTGFRLLRQSPCSRAGAPTVTPVTLAPTDRLPQLIQPAQILLDQLQRRLPLPTA